LSQRLSGDNSEAITPPTSSGTPQTPADLASHRLIAYLQSFGGRSPGFEYEVDGHALFVPMPGVLTVNNSDAYVNACLAGLGIIQSVRTGLTRHLDSGRLVEILPDFKPAPMPVSPVYANRRHLPLRVHVFMEWLGDVMRERLGNS
jgi:DNA-binding transcriptional LysR family regulator